MRRLTHMLVLAAPLLLAGCGASQSKPTAQDDAAWDQAMLAGRDSFELGRYTVAVSQYRKAANLALVRDDGTAVAEAGYDLAVSQLAANAPAQALQTTQATRQAVQLRGAQDMTSLDLVEAASHYRLGHYAQAVASAGHAMQSSDTALAARAALVMGLAADAQGDQSGLQTAATYLNSLKQPLSLTQQADRAEIQARMLGRSNPALAEQQAEEAADLRQSEGSYHDMARALALAARIAASQGDQAKAHALWARAAQSAAAQSGSLNRMDAQTLAHGSLTKGNATPPADDAQVWARNAGDIVLSPFSETDGTH
ncbi:hypothetical protein GOB86_01860 [Acetobacter lambici]|uniref:MalT-like TPR region domain-containing protein n=1 Tax=Acetobacter lambici TaxID=1332824 RepID=A0ABT1EWM0_9PROT|nr:hypothetical protein [Acetobacter lambici]MCP1243113.1 hypothetical protein [Acetobacter lambici]MCP1257345.1 hypothetical protein [Acetobacter lambici]NHO55833.1 hypothetical protein [Acetobacter lambici]